MAHNEEGKEQEDNEEAWSWTMPWEAIRRLKRSDVFFDHECTLTRCTFFAGRSQCFLKALVETLSVEIFPPGKDIIKQGEVGERAYFLNRGKVGIYIDHGKIKVAELEEGNLFGEMAIFGNGKRSATVRAEELCDCRVIQFISFQQLMRSFPQERAHFKQIADKRSAETQEAKRKQLNKRRFASAAKMAVVMQPKASPAVGARRSSDAALTLKKSLPSVVHSRRMSETTIRLPGLDTSRSPPGSARAASPRLSASAGWGRSISDPSGGLLLASAGDAAASSKMSPNDSSVDGPHHQVSTEAPLKPSKLSRSPTASARAASPRLSASAGMGRSISDHSGGLRLASAGDAAASSKTSPKDSSVDGPHHQVSTEAPLKPSKLPPLAPRSSSDEAPLPPSKLPALTRRSISDVTGNLCIDPQRLCKSLSASSISSKSSSLSSNPPEERPKEPLVEAPEQESLKYQAGYFSCPAVDDTVNFSPSSAANDLETPLAKLECPGVLILQSPEDTAITAACQQDIGHIGGMELSKSQQREGYGHSDSEGCLRTAEGSAAISACKVTPLVEDAGSQSNAGTSDVSKSSRLVDHFIKEEGTDLQHTNHLQYHHGKFYLETIPPTQRIPEQPPERPRTPRWKSGMWWRSRASCAKPKRDRSDTIPKGTEPSSMMFGMELLEVGP
eukprot:TRINITY_DN2143_c0_g1_i3.p1 TRINITY_DN2143_c0_g1~~TRINITY_DN2143_c0_g1_i3.p1  ORF type:complete len:680 (-),score=107.83 TRINITY_DN2143_c0_g1_i3:43-2058(-)